MRNRGAVVIIQNGKAALIKRVKSCEEYFVFPGGGIEQGETPENAAIREAFEELGVTIQLNECITEVYYKGKQYFYSADILDGKIDQGQGEEFNDPSRGAYEPIWVSLEEFPFLDIRPQEVARKVGKGHSN
jgi:8-oxo-dGTP diphosphatase